MDIAVSLTVFCKNQAEAMKATETLGRAGLGLALDGMSVSMHLNMPTEDEEIETHIE